MSSTKEIAPKTEILPPIQSDDGLVEINIRMHGSAARKDFNFGFGERKKSFADRVGGCVNFVRRCLGL